MLTYDILYIMLGVIVLPAIIFAAYAQTKVTNSYNKNMKLHSQKGIVAKDMARQVLDTAGLSNVAIKIIPGQMTDHYNTRTREIAISEANANSSSFAALGVVAHEIGHALQHSKNYVPLKLRNLFGGLANFFNRFLIWFILLSIIAQVFLWQIVEIPLLFFAILIGTYGLTTIVSLITLPVEFNASKRTELVLVETGLLDEEEYAGVKEVLNAAALTYVAAAAYSLMQLARIVIYFLIKTRGDRK